MYSCISLLTLFFDTLCTCHIHCSLNTFQHLQYRTVESTFLVCDSRVPILMQEKLIVRLACLHTSHKCKSQPHRCGKRCECACYVSCKAITELCSQLAVWQGKKSWKAWLSQQACEDQKLPCKCTCTYWQERCSWLVNCSFRATIKPQRVVVQGKHCTSMLCCVASEANISIKAQTKCWRSQILEWYCWE